LRFTLYDDDASESLSTSFFEALRLGRFASHPCLLDALPSHFVLQPQAGAILIIGCDGLDASLLANVR
jgi:hypothetical protein